MRLLVTRPADQAEQTAQKLRALGHLPIVAPVLEIAPTGAPLPQGGFDLVLATSAQALATVPLTAELLALPLACVGEKPPVRPGPPAFPCCARRPTRKPSRISCGRAARQNPRFISPVTSDGPILKPPCARRVGGSRSSKPTPRRLFRPGLKTSAPHWTPGRSTAFCIIPRAARPSLWR